MYFGNKQRQYIYIFVSDEKRLTQYIYIYLSVSGKVSDGNKRRKKYVIVFFKYEKKGILAKRKEMYSLTKKRRERISETTQSVIANRQRTYTARRIISSLIGREEIRY